MAPMERAMSSYEARRATFFQQNDGSTTKSRKKGSGVHAWPHPVSGGASSASSSSSSSSIKAGRHFPTPSEMANAGLYFLPTHADANDACAVYPEGTVICHWKAGDDVESRVREADEQAALVMLSQSKAAGKEMAGTWQWTDERLVPNGKKMNEIRLKTFSSFWPYDGKKGWKPSSKKLALAGFHFTPNDEEEDCATCIYCDCSLGGWEKTDDPVKEHQRRRSDCAFFKCQLATPIAVVPEKSKAAPEGKRQRAVSKRKVAEDEAEKQESEVKADSVQHVKASSPARPKKQRKSEEKTGITPAETAAPPVQARKASSKIGQEVLPLPVKQSAVRSPPPSSAVETVQAHTPPAIFESHSRSSLHPAPFSIAPLDRLPTPSKAEREMTVEAWLKMQVTKACEEMEREGAKRIEALRQEMANARGQVEAMLRGRSHEKVTDVGVVPATAIEIK